MYNSHVLDSTYTARSSKSLSRFVTGLALALVSVSFASAAVSNVVTTSGSNQSLSNNLLAGLIPTEYAFDQPRIGGLLFNQAGAAVSTLTDQSAVIPAGGENNQMFSIRTGDVLTYSLGAAYNLTQAQIYVAWNDSGRDDFSDAKIEFSTNGTSFITLVDGITTNNVGNGGMLVISTLSDGGDIIAGAVTHLRFTFSTVENAGIGGTELFVLGTPSIPEPSTYAAAFGAFALGFAAYIRRRRA